MTRYLVVWRPDLSPEPRSVDIGARLMAPLTRAETLPIGTVSAFADLVGDLHDEDGRFVGRIDRGLPVATEAP